MPSPEEIRDKLGCNVRPGDVVTVPDAKLIWPNFSGDADQFNAEGDRNFNIHLTQKQADELTADGWNVKCKPARPDDPDSEDRCVLKIVVKFKNKPPKIVMRGSQTRNDTILTQETAGLMDSAEIVTCDLSFVPHFYEITPTNFGVNAYLKTLYCVVQEDDISLQWEAEKAEAQS